MTIVTEARGVLRNGTSAVLANVQRRQKRAQRLTRITPEKLMKQVTRRLEGRKTRRVPVVPIVIASSVALVGAVIGTIMLRRYLAAEEATEEIEEEYPDMEAYDRILAEK